MIEVSRYLLALAVAQTHLWPLGAPWIGWQSVFAFYALSGFLMTRVLNERYGFALRGTAVFLANRVLRLWPAYLVTIAISLAALQIWPLGQYVATIRVPRDGLEWLTTLTILGQVGFDFSYGFNIAKPATTSWSLSIELFCYLILALGVARSPRRLLSLAAVGLVLIVWSTAACITSSETIYGRYCFQNRYGTLQAGFIPFAVGGLVYFHLAGVRRWLSRNVATILLAFALLQATVATSQVARFTIGPYLGIIVAVWALAAFSDRKASSAQDFFGRASYHLFIAHMSIAGILYLGLGVSPGTPAFWLLGTLACLAISAVMVPIEWRVERVRRALTAQSESQAMREREAVHRHAIDESGRM
jgi:peptidoglycan/LPS O-acetylase OafA/YrhL